MPSSDKEITESDTNNNFKVVVRVRPPLKRELNTGKFASTVKIMKLKKIDRSH